MILKNLKIMWMYLAQCLFGSNVCLEIPLDKGCVMWRLGNWFAM